MALYHEQKGKNAEINLSIPSGRSTSRRHSEPDRIVLLNHEICSFSKVLGNRGFPQQEPLLHTHAGQFTPPRTSRFASSAGMETEIAISPLVRQFVQVQGKIYSLREKVLQTRSQLDFEKQKLCDIWRLQSQSSEQVLGTLHEAMESDKPSKCLKELSQLHEQCAADFSKAEAQTQVQRRASNELNNLEFLLMDEERSLTVILENLCLTLGIHIADVEAAKDFAAVSDDASSELPPILQRFYDRSGDVSIQQERLQELVAAHQEYLEACDLLVDRGDLPSTPDEEVQKNYELQRETILCELAAAECDVEGLAQACKTAGIDTEARRHPVSPGKRGQDQTVPCLSPPSIDAGASPLIPSRSHPFRLAPDRIHRSQLVDEFESQARNATASVHDWLETTEAEPLPTSNAIDGGRSLQ